MNFDFIGDRRFQELLERDYQELKHCKEVKGAKSILVLSGSIIEALLIEYFLQFPPSAMTEAQIYKFTLAELIDLAERVGLLTTRDKNLASVIRDYRNLIHPGKEIRKRERFDMDTANIAEILLNIVANAIRDRYTQQYRYTAQEIIHKLQNDWTFQSIFGSVITKLPPSEKVQLLEELIKHEEYEKSFWEIFREEEPVVQRESYSDLDEAKSLVNQLKPLLKDEVIKQKLSELIREIQAGDRLKAFVLYNLFHEELGLLDEKDREDVVVYMLTFVSTLQWQSRNINSEKTYSTIGKYIQTSKTRNSLIVFTDYCAVNFGGGELESEMDIFEQVYNSLDEDTRKNIQDYIIERYPYERLPDTDVKPFYDSAVRRKMLPPPVK